MNTAASPAPPHRLVLPHPASHAAFRPVRYGPPRLPGPPADFPAPETPPSDGPLPFPPASYVPPSATPTSKTAAEQEAPANQPHESSPAASKLTPLGQQLLPTSTMAASVPVHHATPPVWPEPKQTSAPNAAGSPPANAAHTRLVTASAVPGGAPYRVTARPLPLPPSAISASRSPTTPST
eukprot:CAMPEP_0184733076 /NCGR_PEP_ID=MMETSP0314-20130426/56353_1 /TAXON_ID=38298 /ORGANISM="Rhodella maculata, Strain CCMP 736" /LENGTH=180 /DNA_ID=CAMNT_0027199813 /DNA_START=85 /DNA_END=624 /DNA_ORIENTATION=-